MPANIYEQLSRDEGVVRTAYRDSTGNLTLGCGHNLSVPISDKVVRQLLEDDVATAYATLTTRLPWVTTLSDARRGVLVNMTFNMGIDGLLGFARMLRAIQDNNWDKAAAELLHSTYAKQVGDRAQRLATQLREDRWI